jgi:hypothetical protein
MPGQYADQPGLPDFMESVRRTKAQYTTNAPKTTVGDYSWQAPGKLPLAQAHRASFPAPGGGVASPDGGGGGEPGRPVQQHHTTHVHEHYYPGSGRDFDDGEAPPIVGSSGGAGGSPIVQTPSGPKPSMNGASELPVPVVEEAARVAAAGLRVPV